MAVFMEIVKLVALLVWIGFGGLSIIMGLWYIRLMKPMMKPMTNMYKNMYSELEEEAAELTRVK